MRKLITVGLFLFVVWPFFLVPKSNAMPPEKRSDIIKLLKISGTAGIAIKMAVYASNQIIDVWQKKEKELTPRAIEVIREQMSAIINEQISDDQAFLAISSPFTKSTIHTAKSRG